MGYGECGMWIQSNGKYKEKDFIIHNLEKFVLKPLVKVVYSSGMHNVLRPVEFLSPMVNHR